jgi:hypothetical protein
MHGARLGERLALAQAEPLRRFVERDQTFGIAVSAGNDERPCFKPFPL